MYILSSMPVSVLFVFGVLLYLEQDCTLYNNDICISSRVCLYQCYLCSGYCSICNKTVHYTIMIYILSSMRVSVMFVFRVLLYLQQDCTLYNNYIYPF